MRTLHIETVDFQSIEKLGGHLYRCLFDGKVAESLRTSQAIARRENKGLRIRLRLSAAPELINVPWELLFDAAKNNYIGLSTNSPIIRKLDLTTSPRIEPVEGAVKVLVMISSPSGHPALQVEQEWEKINTATEKLQQNGRLSLTRVDPSLSALQRQLRHDSYHIFHYIGHGGFDANKNDGLLILEDSEGKGHKVSGQYLGSILYDHHSIKLALLNSCSGGRTSVTDPFAGMAQSLLQKDIPAIIAMQFEITDEAAITFSQEFYSALSDGYPIDAAVAEARKMIYAQANQLEWATPVLYTSIDGGTLLERKPLQQTTQQSSHDPLSGQSPKKGEEAKKTPSSNYFIFAATLILLVALIGLALYKFTDIATQPSPSIQMPPDTEASQDTKKANEISVSEDTENSVENSKIISGNTLAKVAFTIDHIDPGSAEVISTYDFVKYLTDNKIPVTVFIQCRDPARNCSTDKNDARKIYNLSPELVTLGIHSLASGHSQQSQTQNLNAINNVIRNITGEYSRVLSYHGETARPEQGITYPNMIFARGTSSAWAIGVGDPVDTPIIPLRSVPRVFANISERHAAGLSSTFFIKSEELRFGSLEKVVFDALIGEVLQGRIQAMSYLEAMKHDFL